MIESAFARFGKEAFQHAIFYIFDNSLRFELAEGESSVERFLSAYYKAMEICESAFSNQESISVCLAFAGDSYLERLSEFRAIRDLEFKFPRQRYLTSEPVEDQECSRNYLFFRTDRSEVHKLLFGKLGCELGITPSFWFDVYLYSMEEGILIYPYDDRGMDVVGPNKDKIRSLFEKYSEWLLDYDIDKMNSDFGIAP